MRLDSRDLVGGLIVEIISVAASLFFGSLFAEPLMGTLLCLVVTTALLVIGFLVEPCRDLIRVVGWVGVNNASMLIGATLLICVAYGAVLLLDNAWAAVLVLALAAASILLGSDRLRLPPKERVALRTAHDTYWRAVDGGRYEIDANANEVDRWETFERIDTIFGKTMFKTWTGQFICVDRDTLMLVAPSRRWRPEAAFQIVELSGNTVAIRAYNDLFVSAEQKPDGEGYKLIADRPRRREWEVFRIEEGLPGPE